MGEESRMRAVLGEDAQPAAVRVRLLLVCLLIFCFAVGCAKNDGDQTAQQAASGVNSGNQAESEILAGEVHADPASSEPISKARPPASQPPNRPLQVADRGYVTSEACRNCHASEHASWAASYHRTMTQLVSSETVAGRFDGQSMEYYGWEFTPERRDGDYWLKIKGTSSHREFDRQLVMTTGSHHMQKYWYPTGKGREVGLAPLIYLMEADKWIPEHTAFLQPTEAGLPVREGVWNTGCNQCHATGSQPRLHGAAAIDTRVAEFGISCEACHGPGEDHVRRMAATESDAPDEKNIGSDGQANLADDSPTDLAIVNPKRLPAGRSVQVCGQCHGAWVMKKMDGDHKWSEDGHVYRPGSDLSESRHYIHGANDEHLLAAVHAEDSFWADGEIRVAGREYNGLLASPCFAHDGPDATRMTCLSCHDLHASTRDANPDWANDQLAKQMGGNEACYQCHESYRGRLPEHTKHDAESTGSLCYNCHMPYTSYGLLKAVRSHTITSPSVQKSVETGRPNACNQCHLDRTLAWTAVNLNEHYGHAVPTLDAEQKTVAASILWALKGDAGQRALMAWSFGWDSALAASGADWQPFFLTDLMFDDYDAIRYIAHRSLTQISGFESLQFDHMKPVPQRNRVMNEVMARWGRLTQSKPPTDQKLLFDNDGSLRMDIYQKLRAQRNNRKVIITE